MKCTGKTPGHKWKASLIEMGFSEEKVSAAAAECSTLRRAVEWLCTHDASSMDESMETETGIPSPELKQQESGATQSIHVGSVKVQKQSEQNTPNNQSATLEPSGSSWETSADVNACLTAKAARPRWKTSLAEMGFPRDKVESAAQECKTLRRAVEWLCSQSEDNISLPADPLTAQKLSPHRNCKTGDAMSEELPGTEAHSKIASPQQKPQGEDIVPLVTFGDVFGNIASPQRKLQRMTEEPLDVTPLESWGCESTPQMASPQGQQNVENEDPRKKMHESIAIPSEGPQAGARSSRRTSLASLLIVPAESWSLDQTRAAFKKLQSFTAPLCGPPPIVLMRRRLRFKQSCPYAWSMPQESGARRCQRIRLRFKQPAPAFPRPATSKWVRMRLRFKQPSTAYPCPTRFVCSRPDEPVGQGSVAQAVPTKGGKLPKSLAKWSVLLVEMGFPADQVSTTLRKHKSLRKSIEALCS
mmetsp:Transcript_151979/g.269250  ORF Transcript_151979/g.269250 Transcript_151979/m.269250 type:complete len:471 (+) Transcript_151979:44-1456(+)